MVKDFGPIPSFKLRHMRLWIMTNEDYAYQEKLYGTNESTALQKVKTTTLFITQKYL